MCRFSVPISIRSSSLHNVVFLLVAALVLSAAGSAFAGTLPEDYQRYELTLQGALAADGEMTLHLNYQDGRFLQGWVYLDGRPVESRVDASQLGLSGGTITGSLDVVLHGNRFFSIDIDAEVDDGGGVTGGHETRYGLEGGGYIFTQDGLDHDTLVVTMDQLRFLRSGDAWSGPIRGTLEPAVSPDEPVRFRIHMGRSLRGPAATRDRVVIIDFVVRGDELVSFDVEPLPRAAWGLREVVDAEVSFDGERIRGKMTIDIESRPLHGGEYEFTFEADVRQNRVRGGASVYHAEPHGFHGTRRTHHAISGRAEAEDGAAPDPANAVHRITFRPSHGVDREVTALFEMQNGQVAGAFVEPIHRNLPATILEAEAALEGGRVRGSLRIDPAEPGYPDRWGHAELAYEFDVRIDDGSITGGYDARHDRAREATGAVVGRQVDTQQLRAANPAPEANWPTWHGPHHTLSAAETGTRIVDDLSEARLLWKSERTPPARAQIPRYGQRNLARAIERGLGGGGASVVVDDGRIYLYYFEPSGEASTAGAFVGRHGRQFKESWKILADDVVLCIDFETGATLWKQRFEQTGLNLYHVWKDAPGAAASVGGGKVFAVGSAGKLWAMDARTGDVLWESTLPAFHNRMQANRERALANNSRPDMGDFNGGTRIVVDGLLVGTDYAGNLVGIDTDTGEKRWRVDGVIASVNTPSLWHGHDEPVVIVGNGNSISAVNVRTGQLLWQESRGGSIGNPYAIPVEDDYLATFVPANGDRRHAVHVAGFRIRADGLERLWTLERPHSPRRTMMIHKGHSYSQGDDAFYRVNLKTGEVRSLEDRGSVSGGSITVGVGDRLLVEPDTVHSGAAFRLFDAGDDFRRIGADWHPPMRGTSGYSAQQIADPVVDGRLIVRGVNGIYAFDLRRRND